MQKAAVVSTAQQLSAYVRALRKARGLTQSDVAKMLGVSKMRVATIEKDVGRVSTASVLGLIQLLGGAVRIDVPGDGEALTTQLQAQPRASGVSVPTVAREVPRRGEW